METVGFGLSGWDGGELAEVVPIGSPVWNTQVRVLRSGTDQVGQWLEEQADVREDYRKLFGVDKPPKPAGIAILTDSDDTKSSAQGDYAGLRLCKP